MRDLAQSERYQSSKSVLKFPATQGRRDKCEPEIIKALEKVGATVEQIPTGKGVPDLLVGFRGQNFLMEVKMPKGKLNAKQVKWHGNWKGQVCVVRTPGEALSVILATVLYDTLERLRKEGL